MGIVDRGMRVVPFKVEIISLAFKWHLKTRDQTLKNAFAAS